MKKIYPILILILSSHALAATPTGEEKKLKIVEKQTSIRIFPQSCNVPSQGGILAFFSCQDASYSIALKKMFTKSLRPDLKRAQELFELLSSRAQGKLLVKTVKKTKYLALLQFLISTYNLDPNLYIEPIDSGEFRFSVSLLHYAFSFSNLAACQYLIDLGATLERETLDLVLTHILLERSEHKLRFIAQKIDNPNIALSSCTSLAHVAAEMGSGSASDALLQRKELLLCANSHKQTPGTIARNRGYTELAAQLDQKLLEQTKTEGK